MSAPVQHAEAAHRPLRIAYFTPEFRSGRDEIFQSQVLGQAGALQDAGFECMMIGSERDAAGVEESRALPRMRRLDEVFLIPCYPSHPWSLAIRRHAGRVARSVQTRLHAWRPDAIYVRAFTVAGPAFRLARQVGAPLVYDARGLGAAEAALKKGRWTLAARFYYRYELRWFARADRMLCVSEIFKDWIRSKVGRQDVAVVPSCIDGAVFRPRPEARVRIRSALGWPEAAPVVVYCGGTNTWQRIDDVLSLMAEMRGREPSLRCMLLTGDVPDMQARAVRAGLPIDAVHCRRVPHDDVPDYLGAADAGIILRHDVQANRVASPVKIAEYLGCGLPVICTTGIGDLSELIRRRDAGLVIGDRDRADDACAALELLRRSASDTLLKARLAAVVSERLTWAAHIETYRRVYRRAAGFP